MVIGLTDRQSRILVSTLVTKSRIGWKPPRRSWNRQALGRNFGLPFKCPEHPLYEESASILGAKVVGMAEGGEEHPVRQTWLVSLDGPGHGIHPGKPVVPVAMN